MPCGSFFTHLGRTGGGGGRHVSSLDFKTLEKKCLAGTAKPHEWSRLVLQTDKHDAKCPWSRISSVDDWVDILLARPELEDKCNWHRFEDKAEGEQWKRLLFGQPGLIRRCDWSALGGATCLAFFQEHPDWVDLCDWSSLNSHARYDVLKAHPEHAERFGWDELEGRNWRQVLSVRPELAVHCRWKNSPWIHGGFCSKNGPNSRNIATGRNSAAKIGVPC